MFEQFEIECQRLFDVHDIPWEGGQDWPFCIMVFWGSVWVGPEDSMSLLQCKIYLKLSLLSIVIAIVTVWAYVNSCCTGGTYVLLQKQ